MRLTNAHRLVERGEHTSTRGSGRIDDAAFDQAFARAAVDGREIDAPAEIEDRIERAFFGATLEDDFHRFFTDVFDRGEAEADLLADGREVRAALVDVGRQDLDVLLAALGEILDDLVAIGRAACRERV